MPALMALLAASFLTCCAGSGAPPVARVLPTSASTIIIFGDSIGYGVPGPSSCVSSSSQPNVVAAASLTGTCWPDAVGKWYGASVLNLAIGGSQVTNVYPSGDYAPGINRLTAPFACVSGTGTGKCAVGQTIPALNTYTGSSYWVIIEFSGANDSGLSPNNPPFATYLANMKTIVTTLLANGLPASHIVLMGYPDTCSVATQALWGQYSALNQQVSQTYGTPFIDIFDPFTALGQTYICANANPDPHPDDLLSGQYAGIIESEI